MENRIEIKSVNDRNYVKILNNFIDLGKSSTIALPIETENSLMIPDDLKARKLAENLNLKFTGLFGVILKAVRKGNAG